jgi:hypothetical protein
MKLYLFIALAFAMVLPAHAQKTPQGVPTPKIRRTLEQTINK